MCGMCCMCYTIGVGERTTLQLARGVVTLNHGRGLSQENFTSFSTIVCWLFGNGVCTLCALIIVSFEVEMLARNPRECLLKPHVGLMHVPNSPKTPTIAEVHVMHVET